MASLTGSAIRLKYVQELVMRILNLFKRNLQFPCNSAKTFLELLIVMGGWRSMGGDVGVTVLSGDKDGNIIGSNETTGSSVYSFSS